VRRKVWFRTVQGPDATVLRARRQREAATKKSVEGDNKNSDTKCPGTPSSDAAIGLGSARLLFGPRTSSVATSRSSATCCMAESSGRSADEGRQSSLSRFVPSPIELAEMAALGHFEDNDTDESSSSSDESPEDDAA